MATISTKRPLWEQLPTELWGVVFAFLTQNDHFNLSIVSRRIHRVVGPVLYSEFNWIPDTDGACTPPSISKLAGHDVAEYTRSRRRKRNWVPGKYGPPPYLLLRTLLNRPTLAHYFRHAKLLAAMPCHGLFYSAHEAREGGLSQREMGKCINLIASMKHVSRQNWLNGLHKGTLDVAVALLLSKMHQLTTIEIRVRHGSVAGSTIFEALTLPVSFMQTETIRSVVVSVDRDEDGDLTFNPWAVNMFDMAAQISGLFSIPEVESLSIPCFAPSGSFWRNYEPNAWNLKKLHLKNGGLREHHLYRILRETPNLQELDCDLVYNYELDQFLNCKILHAALGQVSGTLQSVKINIEVYFDRGWDVVITMAPMKHFKKLKYYPIPLAINSTCTNTALLDILKFR